jgi:hypothetical protein
MAEQISNKKVGKTEISRRRLMLLGLGGLGWTLPTAAVAKAPSRSMQQPQGISLLETRAKLEMELEGELRLSSEAKPSRTAPLKSKATQDYLETVAFADDKPVAAARHYLVAKAENWVDGQAVASQLRPELSHTIVLPHEGSWQQYCPSQPMDRREADLLRSPINSLALERLLSIEPARTDSQWTISPEDAKDLFNLEAVQECQIQVKVAGVEKGTAKVELSGKLEGTADSVPTNIQLRGSAHVALASQCALVTWLGVSMKETRQISERQPGFSVTARLQLVRQELPGKQKVTSDQLLQAAKSEDKSRWLVRLESQRGKFAVYADRRWITYLDSGEDVVLRYIDNNRVIAQCNILQLTKLDAGSQLTIEGLQADIKALLAGSFQEFVETAERTNSSGLRLLRTEVAGQQEEVAIRWIYAHLSDDSGRRLAMVFTLAAEFSESFAGQDLQMLDSLEFYPGFISPVDTVVPAPAKLGSKPANQSNK